MAAFTKFIPLLLNLFILLIQAAPYHGRNVDSPYAVSPYSIDLEVVAGATNPQFSKRHSTIRRSASLVNQSTPLVNLHGLFAARVEVADQFLYLVVDTGSADTWVADSFLTCVSGSLDSGAYPTNQDDCAFGTLFDQGDAQTSFETIPDSNFRGGYVDGTGAAGLLAQTSVRLAAGLTVPNQQIGIATIASWTGDNVTSGVLGLGYSALTSKYPGTNIWNDKQCSYNNLSHSSPGYVCNQESYPALIETLFQSPNSSAFNLPDQSFSIALSRDHSNRFKGGTITFGGTPDLSSPNINTSTPFTTTPIEIVNNSKDNKLRFYALSLDGFMFPATTPGPYNITSRSNTSPSSSSPQLRRHNLLTTRHSIRSPTEVLHPLTPSSSTTSQNSPAQFILDTGTTLSYIPQSLSTSFNSLFVPPAAKHYTTPTGPLWALNCSTLSYIPSLGITISGTTFYHNPEDLVYRFNATTYDADIDDFVEMEYCISTIQDFVDSGSSTWVGVLGQPFLKNVLAVFDVGRGELGFAAREYYYS